ncbi:hypothetical protein [Rhodoblastus sp.]|uniref:hypothetical protein n=2 Tax=Rhodoblastus sp. TaxID=1962975 RepID=UPI003F970511
MNPLESWRISFGVFFALEKANMKHIVVVSSFLLATPAFSGDILRLPGVTDLQRVIDGRPDPNSLSATTQQPEHGTTLESQDKTPPGESLSPKLNPPGLEFKKSF